MAYDEDLANRIRALVADQEGLSERSMFGGLAFLINGNMAVTASGRGGIMVRVEPEQTEHLLATTRATPMIMQGREVEGWIRLDTEHVRTKRQLASWVSRGTAYARSLPAKGAKRGPRRRAPR